MGGCGSVRQTHKRPSRSLPGCSAVDTHLWQRYRQLQAPSTDSPAPFAPHSHRSALSAPAAVAEPPARSLQGTTKRQEQRSSRQQPVMASLKAYAGFRTAGEAQGSAGQPGRPRWGGAMAVACAAAAACLRRPPPPARPSHRACALADSMPVRPQTSHSAGFWQASQRAVTRCVRPHARCCLWCCRWLRCCCSPPACWPMLGGLGTDRHSVASPAAASQQPFPAAAALLL